MRGPLAKSYPAAVALVVLALVPYLALTGALVSLSPLVAKGVGLSRGSLDLTNGMANAAYAFGTVLAVQLAVHLPQRRMLVVYAVLLVVGSILAAGATTSGVFIAGHVLQGFSTSLMLIAAAPTLVTGWPVAKLPLTATTMNLCVFGAVAAGPTIGGLQAAAGGWRPLLWIVAGVSVLALLFAALTYEDDAPADPRAPWDLVAMALAGGGCAAAFFGGSELSTHSATSTVVAVPLVAGLVALLTLVLHQYHAKSPLVPVRQFVSTIPLAGIVTAMCAGGASVATIEIAQTVLGTRTTPGHEAVLFLPELGAAVLAAGLFGLVMRTRWLPALALGGLVLLAAGAALLTRVASASDGVILAGTGLVGLGVGGAVVPALFCAGFSLESTQIQRVFALIELLRGAAAFLTAPILLHVAMTVGSPASGARLAVWIALAIAVFGAGCAVALFVAGGVRLRPPDLDSWQEGEGTALHSPALAARWRNRDRVSALHAAIDDGARDLG